MQEAHQKSGKVFQILKNEIQDSVHFWISVFTGYITSWIKDKWLIFPLL